MTTTATSPSGLARKSRVEELSRLLDQRLVPLGTEQIDLNRAANRVLAEDVVSPVAVPCFDRSAMDGYALHSRDTVSLSHSRPLVLQIVGTARPAQPYL